MLFGFREVKWILVGGMTSGLAERDGQAINYSEKHETQTQSKRLEINDQCLPVEAVRVRGALRPFPFRV